ncbi:MAG TPA: DUF4062 domain-containing protein [Symbiobacteriaceae bacterium]|nr:DUF4062 domain-containing protein [Symbiobacteriaceae bacterium]
MRKRYQIFVSSTYEDLKAERQAAVEAILKAGHIPAGMELFTAGDQSQMQVIRQWIDDSDIYMLILGGRYGSIEPSSGLSYTELEFDYAVKQGKPYFTVVLRDEGLEAKVRAHGTSVMETKNPEAYKKFRERVVSNHLCAFFSSTQDVKLAVHETLPQIIATRPLVGWVSSADAQPSGEVTKELARLSQENLKLREENNRLQKNLDKLATDGTSFDELFSTLEKQEIEVPASLIKAGPRKVPLLRLALASADQLAAGVDNSATSSAFESFLYWNVAAKLATYGLVEHGKSPSSAAWQRLKLSKEGIKFFTRAQVLAAQQSSSGEANPPKNAAKSTEISPDTKRKTRVKKITE